jgi:hypothetical protein
MELETRLDRLEADVSQIASDVRSLLESRSFVRGAWKAIVTISLTVSAVVSGFFAWVNVK